MYLHLEKQTNFHDIESPPLRKKYTHQIISNLNWQVGFLHEIDLIQIGSLRIEKRRFGGFSLGGYNQLIIDDLVITLPQGALDEALTGSSGEMNTSNLRKKRINGLRTQAEEVLAGYPTFSALKINNFKIDAYLSNGSITNVLVAEQGKLKEGLVLELTSSSFTSDQGNRLEGKKVDFDLNDFVSFSSENLINYMEFNFFSIDYLFLKQKKSWSDNENHNVFLDSYIFTFLHGLIRI